MLIETSRFGALDLEEKVFIEFPWGIPGFEHVKRYVLLEHRQGPFRWLQAVDEPDLAFVVCEPEVVGFRYGVPAEKGRPISLQSSEDLVVLIMVSFDRLQKRISPHWRSPLLFNSSSRLAYQWSMDEADFKKYVQEVEKT
jgi:flagellar assembly factor FliW